MKLAKELIMDGNGMTLTPNILRAIGENTKMKILKELSAGPRVPVDISRRLNKSAPTIVEHLEKLCNAGLVERQAQTGKKYVFYSLTQTGEDLISSKSRITVMLYGSIIMFVAALSLFGIGYYNASNFSTNGADAIVASATVSAPKVASSEVVPPMVPFDPLNLAVVLFLTIAFLLLLAYALKLRQMRVNIGE
jgi:DNA-binding HxlR family transcriptional regulator